MWNAFSLLYTYTSLILKKKKKVDTTIYVETRNI